MVGNKIHCIKINPIVPLHFTQLISKLKDKRVPPNVQLRLEYMLKSLVEMVLNFSILISNQIEIYIVKN